MSDDEPRIIRYSEKSIAVIGDTRPIKDELMNLGGKYNPRLTFEGAIVKGYIFSASKEKEVKEFIRGRIEEVEYQEIKIKVFKPKVGMKVFLYTYPDDDIENDPEKTEAIITKVFSSNKNVITKMEIKYQDQKDVKSVITDGKWSLLLADFPNYIDVD